MQLPLNENTPWKKLFQVILMIASIKLITLFAVWKIDMKSFKKNLSFSIVRDYLPAFFYVIIIAIIIKFICQHKNYQRSY